MYSEYDPNDPSLGQAFANMLRGFQNPQQWQEAGTSLKNALQLTPNVTESLGRGGVGQAIGTMGDLRDIRNTVQSYLPKSVQNFSNAAEFMTNPYAKALIQTAPTTEKVLETVPRVTPEYEGFKQHETLGEFIAPSLGYFGGKALKAGKNLPVGLSIEDVTPPPAKVAEALRQPEKNALGFYSPLDEAVMNLQNPKGTGQQYLAQLLKTQGVKQEEVATRGLDTFLAENPKVTKTQIEEFLAENPVQLKETTLAEPKNEWQGNFLMIDKTAVAKIEENADGMYVLRNTLNDKVTPLNAIQLDDAVKKAEEIYGVSGDVTPYGGKPKFADYTLPNGENYREVLVQYEPKREAPKYDIRQLPEEDRTFGKYFGVYEGEKLINTWHGSGNAEDWVRGQKENFKDYGNYESGHFDQPNILAHMRVTDRTIDGKKTLFVEEIQSDWHQSGRKKGYKTPIDFESKIRPLSESDKEIVGTDEGVMMLNDKGTWGYMPSREQAVDYLTKKEGYKVPDAPFKKNWQELAMKRAMQMAAEGGYDRVAFTTGKQQADRYNLAKTISELRLSKNGELHARTNQNPASLTHIASNVTADNISDYVGKEAAKKLLEATPNDAGAKNLKGVDLEIGGEGMKGFYDKILPDFINKYGKKHGLKVGQTTLSGFKSKNLFNDQDSVHYFDLTPEAKESFLKKGQPMFAVAPAMAITDEDSRREVLEKLFKNSGN